MLIKSLKIKGFKAFENEIYIEFDDKETIIEGENYQGKTSIGEAICWCFLGTNLYGNDKIINIINKNSINAYCELKFIDNDNEEHTIIRSKGKENIVILDGKKANIEMLSKFYYDKKVFLCIFNPYYFSSLEPKEQRELLRGILPTIDYKEAFEELLSRTEQEILVEPRVDINGFIKSAREEIKELNVEENTFEGRRQYAASIVNSVVKEEKIFEHEKLLELVEAQYENCLKTFSGETKKEMQYRINDLNNKILLYKDNLDELRKQYKESKKILSDIEQDETKCPICNCKIANTEKVKEIKENNIKLIEEITIKGKEIETEIQNLIAQKNILDIKCNTLNPNEEKEELLDKMRDKIALLKLEKEDVQKYNIEIQSQIKAIEKAKKDIISIDKALDEVRCTRNILTTQISTAITLNNLIIKKQMEMVRENLDRVELVFSKVDKNTGEIKDDYKIFYDGKEFNVLSLSEKIRATLEISNLINKEVDLNAPTFIDNSECITHYNKAFDNQVILAKVEKEKNLTVNSNFKLVV